MGDSTVHGETEDRNKWTTPSANRFVGRSHDKDRHPFDSRDHSSTQNNVRQLHPASEYYPSNEDLTIEGKGIRLATQAKQLSFSALEEARGGDRMGSGEKIPNLLCLLSEMLRSRRIGTGYQDIVSALYYCLDKFSGVSFEPDQWEKIHFALYKLSTEPRLKSAEAFNVLSQLEDSGLSISPV